MLSTSQIKEPPGFFCYRWQPESAGRDFGDLAIVFKVPGGMGMNVLSDLFEDVCRGPITPDAVILIHLKEDQSLAESLSQEATLAAAVRFHGRMPLLRLEIEVNTFKFKLHKITSISAPKLIELQKILSAKTNSLLQAGLENIFRSDKVIVRAPAGYAFQKPSKGRSTHFIRAEQALATSGCVSFVALTVLQRLVATRRQQPHSLKVIYVDTMSVATVAYALRELLSFTGSRNLPQIESFHSYEGMKSINRPLPGTTLCLISASSSMNLHREWVQEKRVPDSDVITLISYADALDSEQALFCLAAKFKPKEDAATAKYDIRIQGETFVPVADPPRKVLLRKIAHQYPQGTELYRDEAGKGIFSLFGSATNSSSKRRGLLVSGDRLIASMSFNVWSQAKLTQSLKASTRQVIYQDDASSKKLAEQVADLAVKIGLQRPKLIAISTVSSKIDKSAALVIVSSVISNGSALLSLSRELRNLHEGPRLYLIGVQVAEGNFNLATFDNNLKQSTTCNIEILRYRACLTNDAVANSFSSELQLIYDSQGMIKAPVELRTRANLLRIGVARPPGPVLLPSGSDLTAALTLNEGFVFWKGGYVKGAYQAEVLATISAILQRARTFDEMEIEHRLFSPILQQVTLDPENFSRFDDGVIQSSLLRAAIPSELDYRGDIDASAAMKQFLVRLASRLGNDQDAVLEFLTALVIGRMRLVSSDREVVFDAYSLATKDKSPLSRAIKFLIERARQSDKKSNAVF